MTVPHFPAPTITPLSEPFWQGVAEGRLMYQRCTACRKAVFPPRAHCPHCWGLELEWLESSGSGTVASFADVHRPGHPAFAEIAPYTLALVDLDEGFRMLTRLEGEADCADAEGGGAPAVGAPVTLTVRRQGESLLPLFTLKEKP